MSVITKYIYYKLQQKNLLLAKGVRVFGIENILTEGVLRVGLNYVGFTFPSDKTLLNVRGKLKIKGSASIGRGCRIDIGENGSVEIGNASYVNCFTKIIIETDLTVGSHCSISWDCQILDSDFHALEIPGKERNRQSPIFIGDRVWIGCKTSIYKGSQIGSGCVVAANSVVRGDFMEENCLIAGNPAKIIKRNVSWH